MFDREGVRAGATGSRVPSRVPSAVLRDWRASLGRMERLDDQTAEWDRERRRGSDLAREYQQAFASYRDRAWARREPVPAFRTTDRFRTVGDAVLAR